MIDATLRSTSTPSLCASRWRTVPRAPNSTVGLGGAAIAVRTNTASTAPNP
jgi:hypothetical protein